MTCAKKCSERLESRQFLFSLITAVFLFFKIKILSSFLSFFFERNKLIYSHFIGLNLVPSGLEYVKDC